MKDKKPLFLHIPTEVLKDKKLKMTHRFVLAIILAFDNKDGCFATNDTIAEYLNTSISTVSGTISALKKMGYVFERAREKGDRGRGVIRSVRKDLKKHKSDLGNSNGSLRKIRKQPSQNNHHNINTNNTLIKNLKDNREKSPEQNRTQEVDGLFEKVRSYFKGIYFGEWTEEEDKVVEVLIEKLSKGLIEKANKEIPFDKDSKEQIMLKVFRKITSSPPDYFKDHTPQTYLMFWRRLTNTSSVKKMIGGFENRIVSDENDSF